MLSFDAVKLAIVRDFDPVLLAAIYIFKNK
jgi:hypothetical protein